MDRVLEAVSSELKQPWVVAALQVGGLKSEQFKVQSSRVTKGAKEAKWNYKYLKIL